jgi:Fe-S cluster assembly protein SufD
MSLELLEQPLHLQAWDRFLEVGLPVAKKNEVYRYVRFKELYSHPFSSPKPFLGDIEPVASTLVFANGAYCEEISRPPKGVVALPLTKAFATYGSFLKPRMDRWTKEEQDPFALLNGAYYKEGLFLYLPPQCVCEAPIRIVHYNGEASEPTHLCPRIHIFAGKEAEGQITWEQHNFSKVPVWINGFVDCALEESAKLTWIGIHQFSATDHSLWAQRSSLKGNSLFKSFSVSRGAATSREDYKVSLQGPYAEASIYGVWSLREKRQHHANLFVDHQAPSCTSLQKFKGILADAAHSSFEGKIYVHQKAQKTQAYQLNNNLVLGERAVAYSKPNLEIFADDVKASHGATMGQIDAEHRFYCQARGIPFSLAQTLLVHGFIREIIDLIPSPTLREEGLRTCL